MSAERRTGRWERRPRWMDYAIAVVLVAVLTAALDSLSKVLPLSEYPISYVLLTVGIAYVLGTGPATVAAMLGWLLFNYLFVPPLHHFWSVAADLRDLARQIAFIAGSAVVIVATGQAQKSRRRVQQLADEALALNRSLGMEVEERRRAEEAIRQSEERFRTLFASLPVGVVLIDPGALNFVLFNDAARAHLGYTAEEMSRIGVPDIEVLHDKSLIRSNVGRFAGGDTLEFETQHRTRTGEIRDVLVRGQAIQAEGRSLALAIWVDITERKNAEKEVRRLNAELEVRVAARTAELEAANKELEAFSYSVSHDLRAPLRAIDGFSSAVLRHYPTSLDERGQDYLQRIRTAAQRMAQLIDDILNLSRAGRAEMHVGPVDMTAVAENIIADLRRSQSRRKAEVNVEQGLIVMADLHLFHIALTNLLDNAWKFTARREVTRIQVGSLERGQIADRPGFEFPPGTERVYYVRDNGAGFDPAYADKLFSPFQRLHGQDEFPGTGIGLALVQRIIRRHGGRIWAESAVDQGATFYFTLAEDGV